MWNSHHGGLTDREVVCIQEYFELRGYAVNIDLDSETVTLTRLSFTRKIELGSFRLLCQAINVKGEQGGQNSLLGQSFASMLGPGFVRTTATARR